MLTNLRSDGGDALPIEEVEAAAQRLEGVVEQTPLLPWAAEDPRVELRLKMETRHAVGAFKARGAWNQIAQLSPEQRRAGVVAASSGNHGRAVAWAAARAGTRATIVMPEDAYPNKIAACRELGAEVVLTATREEADREVERRVARSAVSVHPFDAERTIFGAGTVGLEIAAQWPEVEVVVLPVGGGGLIAGSAVALRGRLGDGVRVLGVEPVGAPTLTLALAAGHPVAAPLRSQVQGLCPVALGRRNLELCRRAVDAVLLLEDEEIYDGQAQLVRGGEVVEPAGAAAPAAVLLGRLPESWLAGRSPSDPLRVAAVVSGGNPDPKQLAAVRERGC